MKSNKLVYYLCTFLIVLILIDNIHTIKLKTSSRNKKTLRKRLNNKAARIALGTHRHSTPISSHFEANVSQNHRKDYLWSHSIDGRDKNMWQNIEYNRYGHNIQDKRSDFGIPAKFEKDHFGGQRIHAPPNSSVQITGPVQTIHNYGR